MAENEFDIFKIVPRDEFVSLNKQLINDYDINVAEMLDTYEYGEIWAAIEKAIGYKSPKQERVLTTMLFALNPSEDTPEINKLLNQLPDMGDYYYVDAAFFKGILDNIKTIHITPDTHLTSVSLNGLTRFKKLKNLIIENSMLKFKFADDMYNLPELESTDFRKASNAPVVLLAKNLKAPSLQKCILPEMITRIPNYCFNGCPQLKEVTIPKNVEKIGYRAFDGCNNVVIKIHKSSNIQAPEEDLKFLKEHIQWIN